MIQITPVLRTKEQARSYYNRISGIYDWLTASEKGLIKKGVEALSPQPGERILEIGCGTGTGLAFIQKTVSDPLAVVGLDLSHQMLRECKKKSTADLLQGDAGKLPLQSDTIDGLFCSFTLELFSEKEIPIVLQEIRRVLKAGGRLVVIALAKQPNTLAVKLYELAHRLFPVAIDCRPIPLIDLLTASGYQIQSTRKFKNWGLPVSLILCNPDW